MQTRKFDELISYFNRKVAEMSIDTEYKMELLGMVTALGLAHEKELTAQPEQRLDEWCTDCKEYDHENSCCHRWTKVIRQTRRELQDEFVMTAVDGTLWVTVDDVQKVGRVIVDEDKSKFCRQFYMDAQTEQRTGRWIPQDHNKRVGNISTCVYYYPTCSECGKVGNETYKYCPHCGAKMEGDAE